MYRLQIFVGGLDPNVSDDQLRLLFSSYGELVHVKIPVGKGCGFVQFANRWVNVASTPIIVVIFCRLLNFFT